MDHVLTGDEHIMFDGMPTGFLLSDFWAWSSSNLLNNTLRGAYAEFVVSAALGLKLDVPQTDWTPYDVYYPLDKKTGIRIEVKSAAYLQAWEQQRLSRIQFTIRPTRAWTPEGGYEEIVRHQSDVYIFCLYAETDRKKADPLFLDKWEFYVLPTRLIEARCGVQRSISLPALLDLCPQKVDYDGIEAAVIEAYKLPVFTPPRKMTNFWYQPLCNLLKATFRLLIPGRRFFYLWKPSCAPVWGGHICIWKLSESRPGTFCQSESSRFV